MSVANKLVPALEHARSTADCKAFAAVLAGVGDKWTILVVGVLSHGTLRYSEIQRRVGAISQRMLTLTLKRLEADGLVRRTLLPGVPPRVDYALTGLGRSLRSALEPLHLWATKNREAIARNRVRASGKRPGSTPE